MSPRYNYLCRECSHSMEESRSIDERSIKKLCPSCVEGLLELQPSAPGIAFKGMGWTGKSGGGRSK